MTFRTRISRALWPALAALLVAGLAAAQKGGGGAAPFAKSGGAPAAKPGMLSPAAVKLAPGTPVFGSMGLAFYRAPHDSVQIMRWLRWLADPAREGRGVGTAGHDSSAAWLAREMRALGLAPGGDEGGWLQSFDVTTGVEVGTPTSIVAGGRTVEPGEEFQPLGFSTNGVVRAPVVFAGYGITAPGLRYDDYEGFDVRDKLVLVMTNEPGEMDSASVFDGSVNTPYAELRTKAINAREHGALGLLVVNGPIHHAGEPIRRPRADGAGYMTSGLIAGAVSEQIADRWLRSADLSLVAAQGSIDGNTRPHTVALPETVTITVTLKRQRARISNVVGLIPGRDTTRTLVVGAHFDHLGYGGESSLTPDAHVPHVGADDNASGTSAMLGVARQLGRRAASGRWRPVHNLVFCAFTGEETGLLGSGHFVEEPTRPLETVETMINMDMVGRMKERKLLVSGAGTALEFPALVANVNAKQGLAIKSSSDGYGPSDHSSFYKKKVPVLFLFTGAHADYHKPSDTWDKINGDGLWRASRFACALVESLDARPRVTYEKAAADSNVGRIAGGGGYGAWLGTIPDYMQTEGGVLLSGVRGGSPAEKAGLQGGDVIVKFDGVRIDNIYDYTFALRSRKPGQDVRVTVKRGAAETDLVATLGRRP